VAAPTVASRGGHMGTTTDDYPNFGSCLAAIRPNGDAAFLPPGGAHLCYFDHGLLNHPVTPSTAHVICYRYDCASLRSSMAQGSGNRETYPILRRSLVLGTRCYPGRSMRYCRGYGNRWGQTAVDSFCDLASCKAGFYQNRFIEIKNWPVGISDTLPRTALRAS
jgi:hypothetical protein